MASNEMRGLFDFVAAVVARLRQLALPQMEKTVSAMRSNWRSFGFGWPAFQKIPSIFLTADGWNWSVPYQFFFQFNKLWAFRDGATMQGLSAENFFSRFQHLSAGAYRIWAFHSPNAFPMPRKNYRRERRSQAIFRNADRTVTGHPCRPKCLV